MSRFFTTTPDTFNGRQILFVSAVGVLAGLTLALSSGDHLQFAVMAIALAPVIMVSFRWPAVFLYLVVLSSAFAGAQKSLRTMDIQDTSLSVSGLRWVVVAAFVAMILIGNLRRIAIVPYLYPFLAFCAVVFVRFFISFVAEKELEGLNDVLFYTLPALFAWFVLLAADGEGENVQTAIQSGFRHGVVLLWTSYILFVPTGLIEFKSVGPDGIVRPRPVGQFGLVALTLAVATWRYGGSAAERRRGAVFTALATALVFFTMSRTAGFAAFLFLIGHRLDPKRIRQFVALVLVAALAFSLLVFSVPMLRARFFYDADLGIDETVSMFRTAGRSAMWPVVLDHALQRPLAGWGLGTARIEAARVVASRDMERFHPHNEFLQVFHDMGLLGLVALIVALATIGLFHLRAWRRAEAENDDRVALWNMAAFLGLWAVILTSVTGNTLHYPFTTLPVFSVMAVGFYLERRRSERLENGAATSGSSQ